MDELVEWLLENSRYRNAQGSAQCPDGDRSLRQSLWRVISNDRCRELSAAFCAFAFGRLLLCRLLIGGLLSGTCSTFL